MKEYFENVIQPYITRKIQQHQLQRDAKALVALDCYSVHRSKEFIDYVKKKHKNVCLVFIPAGCTGKFQVADISLNHVFKSFTRIAFENWAADTMYNQLVAHEGTIPTICLSLSVLKPKLVGWTTSAWTKMAERRELITQTWKNSFYDLNPLDEKEQEIAYELVTNGDLQIYFFVPNNDESDEYISEDSDTTDDELDIFQRRVFGKRKSSRQKKEPSRLGYLFRSDQVEVDN